MWGTVESTKAKIPSGSNGVVLELESVETIDWSPTVKKLKGSAEKEKETSLGENLVASKPPKVKLALVESAWN